MAKHAWYTVSRVRLPSACCRRTVLFVLYTFVEVLAAIVTELPETTDPVDVDFVMVNLILPVACFAF